MCFPVIIPSIQIVSRMRCVLDLTMLTLGQFQLSVECSPDCLGFALLRSTIGSENQRDALNQSDAKRKPIVIWSPAFSRTFGCFLFLP